MLARGDSPEVLCCFNNTHTHTGGCGLAAECNTHCGEREVLMPMPGEYHEGHGNHENANYALGSSTQDASNMTANMYRVGGK